MVDSFYNYSHMRDGAIVTNRRGQIIAAHRAARGCKEQLIEREPHGYGTKRLFLASVSLYPNVTSLVHSVDAQAVYVFKGGRIARKRASDA